MDTGSKVDLKALVALAKACRKAGIKHFSGYGMEFTLDETLSTQRRSRKVAAQPKADSPAIDPAFDSDMPDRESLLFWSTGIEPGETQGAE